MTAERMLLALLLATACRPTTPVVAAQDASETAPARSEPVEASTTTPTPAATSDADLPPVAPALDEAVLGKRALCGPFSSHDLEETDHGLLEDRLRVQFFRGGDATGDRQSARLQVERDGTTLFVGAREMFQRGDEQFERRAAKSATFGGDYDAVTIPGRDPSVSITTGMVKGPDPSRQMLAVAHGWFLDPNRDVLDVAVFVSTDVTDLDGCRRLAQIILHTVAHGGRLLTAPAGGETVTTVSYAKFRYTLPDGWMLASSMGIHDFARIQFRKLGAFPDGFVSLELGLDSHPGEWTSPGTATGDRDGNVLGIKVKWHLTEQEAQRGFGAWTISEAKAHRDHAVASIYAGTAAERDQAIALAESIRVEP